MKYELNLKVKYEKEINSLFGSFEESSERVSVKILKDNENLIFQIKADDSVALRSVMNSITKLFTVYEKLDIVEELKNGK
jgi:tRNA threonylcarbamoyladenosine modification (KEOPS) complex  Pcc1 subunit